MDPEVMLLPEGLSAAVCFETLEHLPDPAPLLRRLATVAPILLASVPNEDVFPFGTGVLHHHRHYTRNQFAELLLNNGWTPTEWWGQAGPESEVEPGGEGRTLIAVCRRTGEPLAPRATDLDFARPDPAADWPVPKHVAILGLGPSLEEFLNITKRLGGRHAYCDEVWGVNALGSIIQCDRVWHMDDVRIQEIRAKARPESNIARMLEWMRAHPGPIYTSRPHPDYPGLVPFPLQDIVQSLRHPYFNNTAAYAIAFAIRLGVQKLSLYGCDYTYPNAHDAERGRACFEFWLGQAAARGIQLAMPKVSSLMDACYPRGERLYGYDTVDVHLQATGAAIRATFTERAKLPTADEIEARYDHSAHPNPLVSGEQDRS